MQSSFLHPHHSGSEAWGDDGESRRSLHNSFHAAVERTFPSAVWYEKNIVRLQDGIGGLAPQDLLQLDRDLLSPSRRLSIVANDDGLILQRRASGVFSEGERLKNRHTVATGLHGEPTRLVHRSYNINDAGVRHHDAISRINVHVEVGVPRVQQPPQIDGNRARAFQLLSGKHGATADTQRVDSDLSPAHNRYVARILG